MAAVLALAVIAATASSSAAASCTPGFADLSFGVGGWKGAPVADLAASFPDNRIAVLGLTSDRYDSLRLAFVTDTGASPPVQLRSPAGPLSQMRQATTDRYNRLLLAGSIVAAPTYARPMLMRRTIDGRPDASFGHAGTVTLPRSHAFRSGMFHAVKVLADGRLVAAGTADDRILLARFSSRGHLDPTFGRNGVLIVEREARGSTELARSVDTLPDRSLLISGEARRTVDPYADEVRIVVARITKDGQLVRKAVSRVDLGTNGGVTGQAMRRGGAWVVGMSEGGQLALARIDRRARFDTRFGRNGVQLTRLRYLPTPTGGSVAGVVAISGGRVAVAATLNVDVELRLPNGDLHGEARETPVVAIFDHRGRLFAGACSPTPILPSDAWAAQFTSMTPAIDGVIISGWTRPRPTGEEDENDDGTITMVTSPILFRMTPP